jgi:alkylated DNA repair protein (DNA oxidative demethylase)
MKGRRSLRPRSAAEPGDLLSGLTSKRGIEALGPGATLLKGFASDDVERLLREIRTVAAAAPCRHMTTPGGFRMSVAMTNCGVGWVTDRRGYRYDRFDPDTGESWPPIPRSFHALAARAAADAGYRNFVPDACLINRYEPDTRLTLHQDRNERDFSQPIVSVSLGLPAVFLWGGPKRSDRPKRVRIESGDVAVWGGPSRLFFHGVDWLAEGSAPLTGRSRINLTFRRAL